MEFLDIIIDILGRTANIYLGVLFGIIFIRSPLKKYRKEFIFVTINIFTPFLVLVSFVNIEFSDNWFLPMIGALLVTLIGVYTPKIIAKLLNQTPPSPAELNTAAFSNGLNFPFPIIFAFAPGGLGYAGMFLAVAIIMRNTVGFVISGTRINKQVLRQILLFPPVVAIFLGLLTRVTILEQAREVVSFPFWKLVFEIGIFMTLMTVGFSIKKPNVEYKIPIFRVSMSRFVVSLFVVLILLWIFNPTSDIAIPLIVQMVAPPAVYNGLYAERFGLDTELTSQIILTLMIIALVFLPFELYAVQLFY